MLSRSNRIFKSRFLLERRFQSNEPKIAVTSTKIVNCWNEFSPLKRVIVGRPDGSCIAPNEPSRKYKIPLDSQMKGVFGPRPAETIKKAQKQVDHFCDLLKSHGVQVDRPEPINWNNKIVTPFFESMSEISSMPVRDVILTVGNEMLEATMSLRSRWFEYRAFRDILYKYWLRDKDMRWEAAPKPQLTDDSYKIGYLDQYESMDEQFQFEKMLNLDFVTNDWKEPLFDAADVCRLGKDLFVQHGWTTNLAGIEWLRRHFPDHRVHAVNFPGDLEPIHIDTTLYPLRPGLIINNPKRRLPNEQRKLFERNGWDIVDAAFPTHEKSPPLCFCSPWLNMNALGIDDRYIMVEASESHLIKQIEGFGFEAIPVPFRDAYPFGGGLHCATVDVYREGVCEDYFPNQ